MKNHDVTPIKYLKSFDPPGTTLLDLGDGKGRYIARITEKKVGSKVRKNVEIHFVRLKGQQWEPVGDPIVVPAKYAKQLRDGFSDFLGVYRP